MREKSKYEHGECLNRRKNESDRDVIDFSLSSDWYAEQCEFFLLSIKHNKTKSMQPRISFGNQLKHENENVKTSSKSSLSE